MGACLGKASILPLHSSSAELSCLPEILSTSEFDTTPRHLPTPDRDRTQRIPNHECSSHKPSLPWAFLCHPLSLDATDRVYQAGPKNEFLVANP